MVDRSRHTSVAVVRKGRDWERAHGDEDKEELGKDEVG